MSWVVIFDITGRERSLKELEEKSNAPDLWEDVEAAQKLMQQLSRAKEGILPYRQIREKLEDAITLIELAQMEPEPEGYEPEAMAEAKALTVLIEELEIQTLLGDTHDGADAILQVNSGAGGTEACDWASMLLRMYLRWAERNKFEVKITDETLGDVAGISSVTVLINGKNAYGLLKSEHGTHRLVRISPYNANGKRQTSFAGVDVMPQIEDANEIVIDTKDIRMDYYLSGGAGGQNVQKNETAVRITHIPTGIVTSCQNERSQLQNREVAMATLRAKLADIARREQEAKLAGIRGDVGLIEWGSQIRSYVLDDRRVKDHRTSVETGDTQGVLDGDINKFQTGYLQWRAEQKREA
jgi:peptide chain release factor 2